jgi:hypothetical protein
MPQRLFRDLHNQSIECLGFVGGKRLVFQWWFSEMKAQSRNVGKLAATGTFWDAALLRRHRSRPADGMKPPNALVKTRSFVPRLRDAVIAAR